MPEVKLRDRVGSLVCGGSKGDKPLHYVNKGGTLESNNVLSILASFWPSMFFFLSFVKPKREDTIIFTEHKLNVIIDDHSFFTTDELISKRKTPFKMEQFYISIWYFLPIIGTARRYATTNFDCGNQLKTKIV